MLNFKHILCETFPEYQDENDKIVNTYFNAVNRWLDNANDSGLKKLPKQMPLAAYLDLIRYVQRQFIVAHDDSVIDIKTARLYRGVVVNSARAKLGEYESEEADAFWALQSVTIGSKINTMYSMSSYASWTTDYNVALEQFAAFNDFTDDYQIAIVLEANLPIENIVYFYDLMIDSAAPSLRFIDECEVTIKLSKPILSTIKYIAAAYCKTKNYKDAIRRELVKGETPSNFFRAVDAPWTKQ